MAEIKILAVISKLRPKVKRGRTVDLDDMADEIADQSGFDRGDARDFAFKFSQALINHLKLGDYVKMGDMGSFGVSCDKDKKLRVTYRAAKGIKDVLATDFRGTFVNNANAGLDEEGFAQRWLELNPEDTVIMRDGSTRTA
jgi:hypothetical protein